MDALHRDLEAVETPGLRHLHTKGGMKRGREGGREVSVRKGVIKCGIRCEDK
jgi:hypothetical protein